MSLKYAIIGCGRISPNHIAAALENNLNIVGLCDLDANKIDAIKVKFPELNQVNEYIDYHRMLENEKVDLLAICTESGNHASVAIDSLDYGCNLIIEKPIALSLEDVDKIIQKSNSLNLKVCACHQNRFNKAVQKIRESIEQKRFGRMLHGTAHIRWSRDEEYYKQAPWRGTWKQDGGALMNQCIHNIDLLRWMMGNDIVEVVGMTDNLNHSFIETEDLGLALIRFSNGSYGVIEGTTNVFPSNLEETLYLFGEKGTVKAGGKSVNIIEEWRFADKLDEPEEIKKIYKENPPSVYGYGHNPLYTDVIDAIKNDREPYVNAYDGRRALELVLAIYKSAAEGKSIKLPLEKCSTLNFEGRFK